MNFNSHTLSTLFEKSLIRIIADFSSEKGLKSAFSELSKILKVKVSSNDPSSHNFQLKLTDEGVYRIITPFLLYRDSRLTIINLCKWIERNGNTNRNHNLFIDLKFVDEIQGPFKGTLFNTSTKIDNIDKLRFALEFDESQVYKIFPERKSGFISKTIIQFEPIQKFIPKENEKVDPRMYSFSDTSNCGINFETLNDGYLRMQYIGGTDYEKKVEGILSIMNRFCVTAWDCVINRNFTKNNLISFEKIILEKNKIRESYYDYAIFKKNYSKVNFTIDLVSSSKVLESYYPTLRDKIYELFSNIKFKEGFDLNYDTNFSVFQIREAKIKCNNLSNLEFVNCEIDLGNFDKCDFFDCQIKNSVIRKSNLFLYTKTEKCLLIDSFANRTTEIIDSEIDGDSVLNGDMKGGIFKNGKLGIFANIDKTAKVIQYRPLKTGYVVAGDQIIIPTKKFS